MVEAAEEVLAPVSSSGMPITAIIKRHLKHVAQDGAMPRHLLFCKEAG